MAKIELLDPIILKWEGVDYSNRSADRGGPTKMGVTLSTWMKQGYDKNHDGHIDVEDLKLLTVEDFNIILRSFWNTWKADQIVNQSVANILVDWVWGSGRWGVLIPQRLLGVAQDGVVGPKTIAMVNATNQENFFITLWEERKRFLYNIVAHDATQQANIHGWINRLNDFKFKAA